MNESSPSPIAEREASGAFEADWLEFARGLGPGSIDLVYADPPFFTGEVQRTPVGAARAGRFVAADYDDRWTDMPAYVGWLRERLCATLPALKPTGVVLIHCDWHASHHIRVMLDEVMGADGFINHLVWSYGLGGSSPRRFARKHDDIFAYAVDSERYHFVAPMVPATSARLKGQMKKATDVLSIPSLNNMAAERTGYPTQKPLELLELLILAFSPDGGTVLDPCFGSGTTLVAALRTGRLAVGCDLNAAAVATCLARIAAIDGDGTRPVGSSR